MKSLMLGRLSIRKAVKGIASFCAGQKYSPMKRPRADILQSSQDVKDTSDILDTQDKYWTTRTNPLTPPTNELETSNNL